MVCPSSNIYSHRLVDADPRVSSEKIPDDTIKFGGHEVSIDRSTGTVNAEDLTVAAGFSPDRFWRWQGLSANGYHVAQGVYVDYITAVNLCDDFGLDSTPLWDEMVSPYREQNVSNTNDVSTSVIFEMPLPTDLTGNVQTWEPLSESRAEMNLCYEQKELSDCGQIFILVKFNDGKLLTIRKKDLKVNATQILLTAGWNRT